MQIMTDTPRIYVASLSDYNAGTLHGVWIDVDETTTADDIQEMVDSMLAESPEARVSGMPAEEWAIHDHEGFGKLLGEWETFERVAEIGAAIAEHGGAVIAYLENYSGADLDDFEESYAGCWPSVEEYAQDLAEETAPFGANSETARVIDSWPYRCIDWEYAARELVTGGDIWTAEAGAPEYGIYVFRSI